MKIRNAFTMIELIFVIVIMGIIGKFGVEFLVQAYNSFIASSINNTLQANSGTAVEFVAARLQDRIKDSVIVRISDSNLTVVPLSDADYNTVYTILEWIGADGDGFRGNSDDITTINKPNWSGIADLEAGTNALIVSPETNTTKINTLINVLSHTSGTTIDNAALYFIGSNTDIQTGYGWNGPIIDQNKTMHPINDVAGQPAQFQSVIGPFQDVYEYYKLAWTAYAVVVDVNNSLWLHYDYQPWNGDTYSLKVGGTPTKKALIMENVSTFQSMAIGSVIKIQVCAKSTLTNQEYSLCKEKTIF